MKSKTHIVLLQVGENGADQDLVRMIDGQTFNNREEVQKTLNDLKYPKLLTYHISDFVDVLNNQDINIDEYFIAHVEIN